VNRRDSSGRNSRYFIASTLIVVGLACAATLTNSLGNDLATVLIALGLIIFIAFLFKDLGLNIDGRSAPRVPDLPPLPEEAAHERISPLTTEADAHEPPAHAPDAPRSAAESARRLAGRDN
jgi:hypothetical protein